MSRKIEPAILYATCGPRLKIGDKVLSVMGENDEGGQPVRKRETGPNAIGTVTGIQGPFDGQGYSYSTTFRPSGVWVFLDDSDFDKDPAAYILKPEGA